MYKYHECRGHPGVTKTVNMIQRYFCFQGLRSSVYNHIRTCKLCTQFLPNRIRTRPIHLEIPKIPFYTICLDTIGRLLTTSKGNCYALTCMDLPTSYLITVPMKSKSADEVTMAYLERVLPTSSCSIYVLQDNRTKFRNRQLVDTLKCLGIKPIYSSPYYPHGNGKLENSHNFLEWSIAKFLHNTNLEWDDIIPIATYVYNISPTANGLESPFYLVFWWDPMEVRLAHVQGYCRYVREQPGRQMVQDLQKL